MKNFRLFGIIVLLYWLILASLLIVFGYKDSFLLLNHLHTPALDYIMYVLTWFGDSLFIASLIILVFPRKTALILMTIISVTITGLLVQALKQWVFPDWDRPLKVFENTHLVHVIGDYRLFHRSFPSGHSVTTATAFTLLAWYFRDNIKWIIVAALMAVVVSYTRIYTGSHFAGDVLAGNVLGTFLTLGIIYYLKEKIENWVSSWSLKTLYYFRVFIMLIATAGLIVSIFKYMQYL